MLRGKDAAVEAVAIGLDWDDDELNPRAWDDVTAQRVSAVWRKVREATARSEATI